MPPWVSTLIEPGAARRGDPARTGHRRRYCRAAQLVAPGPAPPAPLGCGAAALAGLLHARVATAGVGTVPRPLTVGGSVRSC